MNTTITLQDLLKIVLYLAGAGVLIYLALVLKNVLKITGSIKDLLDANEVAINDTIKQVPQIAQHANKISSDVAVISGEANHLVGEIKPEVQKLAATMSNVSDTVDGISHRLDTTALVVSNTVNDISGNISDTAKTISINANNVIDYFYILREVIEALRDVFLSR